jgi:hypothetical protein
VKVFKALGGGRVALITGATVGSAVVGGTVLHMIFGGKHTDQVDASREVGRDVAAEPAR